MGLLAVERDVLDDVLLDEEAMSHAVMTRRTQSDR